MNYEKILYDKYHSVNPQKTIERINHSKNVVEIAKQLNQLHHLQIQEDWIEQAGYLHDYAKYVDKETFQQIANLFKQNDLLKTPRPTWHAFFAPYLIEIEIAKFDQDVMDAIRFHTTGRKNMTPLQELILLADFIEKGRTYIQAKQIRTLAQTDYKKAIALVLKNKIEEVTVKKEMIHTNTLEAYQDYEMFLHPARDKLIELLHLTDHNLMTDIKIYDTTKYSPLFDAVMISTALSNKQMGAAVSYIASHYEIKGLEKGDFWILIDLSDVIVHLFLEDARKEYGLDRLYGDLPQLEYNK